MQYYIKLQLNLDRTTSMLTRHSTIHKTAKELNNSQDTKGIMNVACQINTTNREKNKKHMALV